MLNNTSVLSHRPLFIRLSPYADDEVFNVTARVRWDYVAGI